MSLITYIDPYDSSPENYFPGSEFLQNYDYFYDPMTNTSSTVKEPQRWIKIKLRGSIAVFDEKEVTGVVNSLGYKTAMVALIQIIKQTHESKCRTPQDCANHHLLEYVELRDMSSIYVPERRGYKYRCEASPPELTVKDMSALFARIYTVCDREELARQKASNGWWAHEPLEFKQ